MKAIVVGAGGIARELLRRLGEKWEVVVVDTSPERLSDARALRPIRVLKGDGSSRVTLQRAGLDQAKALIAATNDDQINLEACRIAREAQIPRLLAVAADPESLADYRALEVEAISPDALAARRLEVDLETRRISSTAFAHGRAEAIEFRIAEDSPVRGKSLKELRPYSWIVGVILRNDRLVIPHGDTVLEAGDLVTVVGKGADFAEIVRMFTSGETRFPLNFGKRIAVALEARANLEKTLSEAMYLARNSKASSLTVVFRDPDSIRDETVAEGIRQLVERAEDLADAVELRFRSVRGRPSRALASLPEEESIGAIVTGLPEGGTGIRAIRAAALVRQTGRPILLSRGSQPYRRILVPARHTPSGRAAVRAAIDLARFSKGELHCAAILDPVFISGPHPPTDARSAMAWIEEEAAVHGVDVSGTICRGNPVRKLLDLASSSDLVVLGVDVTHGWMAPRMGVGRMVAQRAPRSVLLVPADESA